MANEFDNETSVPATPLQPAFPNPHPPRPPMPPRPHHPHDHVDCGPGRRHLPLWCGPVDTTKVGDWYDVAVPPHGPVPPEGYDIKPLIPYVPGLNMERQIGELYGRVNELIGIFNQCNDKMFGAYQAVVDSVTCNDAYYREITTEEGYFPENQVSYKITHIPFIGRDGNPIYLELGLPDNSKINDGHTENCYSCSKRTLADKLIPATQSGEEWKGYVIHKGRQISAPNPPIIPKGQTGYYTLGVTENGYIKWYPSDVSIRTLNVEKVRSAMNASAILIADGKITPELFSPIADQTIARVAIGMNYQTKERFIIVVDGSEQTGCTEMQLAELFYQYGCTVALQTAYSTSAFGMDKGLMMFTPSTVDSDQTPTMPAVSGFWYITKRRLYRNAYVREVAYLTQLMGEQIWYDWINADSIDYVKDRIRECFAKIEQEIKDRIEGDEDLQNQIDELELKDVVNVIKEDGGGHKDLYVLVLKSGERISIPIATYNYDNLNEKLATYDNLVQVVETEIKARQDGDDKLLALINKEIQDRIDGDNSLKALIGSTKEELLSDLAQETSERKAADNQLKTDILNEENARQMLEITLKGLINAEASARELGDNNLANSIASFRQEFEQYCTTNDAEISGIKITIDNLRSDVNTAFEAVRSDIQNLRSDVTLLQVNYNQIVERLSALNEAVTSLQSAFNTLEQSFDNIKAAFSTIQEEWHTLKEEFAELKEYWQTEFNNLVERLEKEISDLKAEYESFKEEIETKLEEMDAHHKELIENGPWLEQITLGSGDLLVRQRPDVNGLFISIPGDDGQDELGQYKTGYPTTPTSAINMEYYENEMANYVADAHNYTDKHALLLTGGSMKGGIDMGENVLTNLPDPENDTDAATKKYVDGILESELERTDETYVKKSGDTMSGNLVMTEDANVDLMGTGGVRILRGTSAGIDLYHNGSETNPELLDDTYTAFRSYTDENDGAVTSFNTVVSEEDTLSVNDTVLRGVANPIQSNDAATKQYVDDALEGFEPDGYVKKTGDTMSGTLNMGEHRITNVGDAIEDGDAVSLGKLKELVGEGDIELDYLNATNWGSYSDFPADGFVTDRSGVFYIHGHYHSTEFYVEWPTGEKQAIYNSGGATTGIGNTSTVIVNAGCKITKIRQQFISDSGYSSMSFIPFKKLSAIVETNTTADIQFGDVVNLSADLVANPSGFTFTAPKSGLLTLTCYGDGSVVGHVNKGDATIIRMYAQSVNQKSDTTQQNTGNISTLAVKAGDVFSDFDVHGTPGYSLFFTPFEPVDVALEFNSTTDIEFEDNQILLDRWNGSFTKTFTQPGILVMECVYCSCYLTVNGTNVLATGAGGADHISYHCASYPISSGDSISLGGYYTAHSENATFKLSFRPFKPISVVTDKSDIPDTNAVTEIEWDSQAYWDEQTGFSGSYTCPRDGILTAYVTDGYIVVSTSRGSYTIGCLSGSYVNERTLPFKKGDIIQSVDATHTGNWAIAFTPYKPLAVQIDNNYEASIRYGTRISLTKDILPVPVTYAGLVYIDVEDGRVDVYIRGESSPRSVISTVGEHRYSTLIVRSGQWIDDIVTTGARSLEIYYMPFDDIKLFAATPTPAGLTFKTSIEFVEGDSKLPYTCEQSGVLTCMVLNDNDTYTYGVIHLNGNEYSISTHERSTSYRDMFLNKGDVINSISHIGSTPTKVFYRFIPIDINLFVNTDPTVEALTARVEALEKNLARVGEHLFMGDDEPNNIMITGINARSADAWYRLQMDTRGGVVRYKSTQSANGPWQGDWMYPAD